MSPGAPKGPTILGVSALFPRILLLEKPGCTPTECPPCLLSQKCFWGKYTGVTGLAGTVRKPATGVCSPIPN